MHLSDKILAGALTALLLSPLAAHAQPAPGLGGSRYLAALQTAKDENDEDDTAAKGAARALTLDEAFTAAKTYKFGDSRQPFLAVARAVRDSRGADRAALSKRVTELLNPSMPKETRKFACRQARLLGDPAAVPALAPMLTDEEEMAHLARYALEPMQAPAAGAALRDALPKTRGQVQIGILDSLGARRETAAVPQIAALTKSADAPIAGAAVRALARIGGADATAAVRAARSGNPAIRADADNALLRLADETARGGGNAEALYAELATAADPAIQAGALHGRIRGGNVAAVSEALAADPAVRVPAINAVTEMPATAARQIATALPTMPADRQTILISLLAARTDAAGLTGVRTAAVAGLKSADPKLRAASLTALGTVGDASAVPVLAPAAAAGDKAEMALAASALDRMTGAGVDAAIVAAARASSGPQQAALIRSLGARRATTALPALREIIGGTDSNARAAAFEAMGLIAAESEIPQIVTLLPKAASGKESMAAEKAVVAAANRVPDPARRADAVVAALPTATAETRPALLRILGAIGGPKAIGALRQGIGSANADERDAAVRAIAAASDPAVAPDLLELARTAPVPTHKILALRGYVRLAASTELKSSARLQMLRDAMAVAPPSERSLVLGGIGGVSSTEALALATSYLTDDEMREEAAVAALRIAQSVLGQNPKGASAGVKKAVRESVERVQSVSTSDATKKQAADVLKSMG